MDMWAACMTEIDYKIKEVIKNFGYHIAFWCSNYKYDTILIFKENKEIKIRLDANKILSNDINVIKDIEQKIIEKEKETKKC